MTQEKKKLQINAAVVDMTSTAPETFDAYKEISINAACVFVTEETKKLVAQNAVRINTASVTCVSGKCEVSVVNGNGEIGPGALPKPNTALIVNGTLTVHPGSEEVLRAYELIQINGTVLAPESLRGILSMAHINGSTRYYPDEMQLVNGDLNIDNRFIKRAPKGKSYFVTGRVMMISENLDIAQMIEKDLFFQANRAFIRTAYEKADELMSGGAEVKIIPDGYEVVKEDVTVDEVTASRYGRKMFLLGGLYVPYEARGLYGSFDEIIVCGGATLPDGEKAEWMKKILKAGGIAVYKGRMVKGSSALSLNAEAIGEYAEGMTIADCGYLKFDPGVTPELIREKIHQISDCGAVSCTEAQKAVILPLAQDCGAILTEAEKQDEDQSDIVRVNAAIYAL